MDNSKCSSVPMQENPDLRKYQGVETPSEVKCMQRVPYALDIGSIMYTQNPVEAYWTAVKTILKNLRTTKDMVLVYKENPKAELKYIVATEASMEVVWIRKFIDGLGNIMPTNKRPIEMLYDNMPAIEIANDPKIIRGARHNQRKYHYIHEVIQDGEIVLKKVHTDDNLVDPFIKPMPYNKHFEHAMARVYTKYHVHSVGRNPWVTQTWLQKDTYVPNDVVAIEFLCGRMPEFTQNMMGMTHTIKDNVGLRRMEETDTKLFCDAWRVICFRKYAPSHKLLLEAKRAGCDMTSCHADVAIRNFGKLSKKMPQTRKEDRKR
ncbi:hypothetical protein Tco_1447986 [Tanacetum coccineum]